MIPNNDYPKFSWNRLDIKRQICNRVKLEICQSIRVHEQTKVRPSRQSYKHSGKKCRVRKQMDSKTASKCNESSKSLSWLMCTGRHACWGQSVQNWKLIISAYYILYGCTDVVRLSISNLNMLHTGTAYYKVRWLGFSKQVNPSLVPDYEAMFNNLYYL